MVLDNMQIAFDLHFLLLRSSKSQHTLGHEDIVRRAVGLFDKVIVAIGANSDKHGQFSIEQRKEWIEQTFVDLDQVEVAVYEGLTTEFCRSVGATVLVRGVRNGLDLAYEQQIADLNRRIAPEIETVLLMTRPELSDVSSSAIRELLKYNMSVDELIPSKINIVN